VGGAESDVVRGRGFGEIELMSEAVAFEEEVCASGSDECSRLARRAALSFVSVSVAESAATVSTASVVSAIAVTGAETECWRSCITIVVAASRADILRSEWLLLAFAFESSISRSDSITSSLELRCRTTCSQSAAGPLGEEGVLDVLWAMVSGLLLHDMTAARAQLFHTGSGVCCELEWCGGTSV
jgi:hypothetical protein